MSDDEDDDVIDSWEDAADSGDLERRMEKREKIVNKIKNSEPMEFSNAPVTILKAENACKTEYSPQIKILKRSGLKNSNINKPKNKTEAEMKIALKVKEAEYQAARNRILGSDYDENKPKLDTESVKISIIQNPSRSSPLNSPPPVSSKIIATKEFDNIIRLPSGPNDLTGFKENR
uniref:UPF0485 protein C1orf144 n=1 Tax=Hydra vulgaris TaxID=6087 RepID=T2MAM7_HYDVU